MVDYATVTPAFQIPRRCGAPACRLLITGNDWQLPAWRDRYQGHVVPAVARRIAAQLSARGVTPGDVVAISLPRSAEMVAAIFGVLTLGAAYLPLDPSLPAERRRFMIEDAGVRVVIDEPLPDLPEEIDIHDHPALDSAAYVIYTSGSTGRPKGAAIQRRGFASLLRWYSGEFGFGPDDSADAPSRWSVSVRWRRRA